MSEFDIDYWFSKSQEKESEPNRPAETTLPTTDLEDQIQQLVSNVEAAAIDLTDGYHNWRDMGFALAEALGENGRPYFHRLSAFYSQYNAKEADKQYTACLRSKGQGITIATLFHLAKQAGVELPHTRHTAPAENTPPTPQQKQVARQAIAAAIEAAQQIETQEPAPMPTLPAEIRPNLPQILQKVIAPATTPQEADMLLLGAITVFSACLPHLYGIYRKRIVYPNVFLFVNGNASSGKGNLSLLRHLVQSVHLQMEIVAKNRKADYLQRKQDAQAKGETLTEKEPLICGLFLPANCSSTLVYQRLYSNNGVGLMFETEGDTLANMLKTDYGNYSDGFRKAFHHESISYARRKDDESVEVPKPRLSVLLSGTPQQVLSLIPNAENGLFSRFLFYTLNMPLTWDNVFDETDTEPLDTTYHRLGEEFYQTYQILKDTQDIRFRLTSGQAAHFNQFFEKIQTEYAALFGHDIIASVRRLGLITFRIAMILNALRITEDGDISTTRYCSDTDYQTAIAIVEVLLQHTATIFQTPPENEITTTQQETNLNRQALYNALPQTFTRQDYLATAATLNIKPKAAEKYITALRFTGQITKPGHNQYEKANRNADIS